MMPFNEFKRDRDAGRDRGTAMTRAEERSLVAAARSGDRRAMTRLLEMVADPALRFGRSFCRQPQDAEEIMQDVLAALARSLQTFRGDSRLSTWAYRVARHACLRRRRPGAPAHEPLEGADPDGRPHLPSDPDDDPARRYERREMAEKVEEAIASLPRAQREVLVLRDVEGLKAVEVGRVLGIGERAVKSRLHRARLALREALAPALGRPAAASRHRPTKPRRCPDTARLVSRYLEGELGAGACATLSRHVRQCANCTEACSGLRLALTACRDYGERPLPREVRARIRQAIL